MNSSDALLAFSLGPTEVIVLLVIMVFMFGPKRIPEIGESVGKALSSFRKASKDEDKAVLAEKKAAEESKTEV